MNQPAKVWLTRSDISELDEYALWKTKPIKIRGIFCEKGKWFRFITIFCTEDFERITGFSLKPGECKRVTIEIKLV